MASDDVLHGPHGAEGTPGAWAEADTHDQCYGSGHQTHDDKDHSYLIYDPLGGYEPVAHEHHHQSKERDPYPEASEGFRYLPASGYLAYPEVIETSPGAEVPAEPPSPEDAGDHKRGKDQQQEVAKQGEPQSCDGYYKDKYAQVGSYFKHGYTLDIGF